MPTSKTIIACLRAEHASWPEQHLTVENINRMPMLQEAMQPWRAGSVALEQAARLPPHLAGFGRDLEAFSSYGAFRWANPENTKA